MRLACVVAFLFACFAGMLLTPLKAVAAPVTYYFAASSPGVAWSWGGLQTQPLPGVNYALQQTPAATDYGRTFLSTTNPAAGTATTWRYEFAAGGDILLGIGLRQAAYATPMVIAASATGRFSIRNSGGAFRFELVDFDAAGAATVLGTAAVATTNSSNTAYPVTFNNAASTVVAGHRIGVRVYVNNPASTRHRLVYGAGANNTSYFTINETAVVTGIITAAVTNSSSGLPVAGARVTAGAYAATTDAGGNATLPNVAAGTYTVSAAKTGFTTGARANVVVTVGSTATVSFALVDMAAPTTSPSMSPGAPGPSGWYAVAPQITLTATDAEGSSVTTEYGWGISAPTTPYLGSFTAPSGTNTLYYRSTDGAGNAETVQSLVFKVDTSITPPAITTPTGVEPTPTPVRGTIYYDSTATDAVSGVDHVAFFWFDRLVASWNPVGTQVGADQTTTVSGTTYGVSWNTALVVDGRYKLQSQLADVAGNTAFSPAQYVLVDNTGPTATLTNPATNARISGPTYAITGTATDANLANWTLQMRAVGGPTWSTLASGTSAVNNANLFTLNTNSYAAGRYEFQIVVTDTSGNSSTELPTPVTIDNVQPTVVSATAVNRNTVNVVFSEDLAPGSINKSYFTIAGLTVSAAALQVDNETVALTTPSQTDGVAYAVAVKNTTATVTDLAGNIVGTPNTATFAGTAVDPTAPAAPSGLAVTSGLDKNDLSWIANLEPDLAGYNVYRDTTSGGTFATKVNGALLTSLSFTDTSFMPNRGVYWYKIAAVDTSNNESSRSSSSAADLVRLSASVTAAGATLTSSTGDVSITIPAAALATATTIQIFEKAQPANRGASTFVSPAYDFSPVGQAFLAPVSITMSYVPGAVDETTIRLVYSNAGTWTQVEGGSTPNPPADTVTGQVDHFTEFATAAIDITPPTVSTVTPANNATGVPVSGFATIVFSEAMDPNTLNNADLQIRAGSATGTPISLETVVFSADKKTVYLYPDRMLDISAATPTDYFVWINGAAVTDLAGNPLGTDVTSKFTTAADGVSPHDGYAASTNLCRNCHVVHGAVGPKLFVEVGEKQVCYTCHDGTGSSYNVKTTDNISSPYSWDFGEDTIGATSKVSYHPVPKASTTAPVTGATMLCSNCHNAHSMTGTGARYLVTKKLDPSYSGAYGATSGNLFCWTCHESTAAASSGYISTASWDKSTGFDHKTYYSAGDTGHNKSTGSLVMAENPAVPSKENIACKGCHSEHGTTNDKLIAEQVNGQAATFRSGTAADYNTYYNPLCLACHGVAGLGGSYWPGSAIYSASGHGTSTAPKALAYAPNDAAGSLLLQVNLCKQCHEPHGAGDTANPEGYPNLTRLFEENVCYRCHGSAPNPLGAKNIQTEFGGAYSHNLGMSTNAARTHDQDAEDAKPVSGETGNSQLSGANRHVECADCHNVHVSTNVLHTLRTNLISGVLAGVSGVDAASPGTAWSDPSSWSWSKKSPATAEYQLCFKCHSATAYGSTPPAKTQVAIRGTTFWNSPTYTDQAREFNPNNLSYHMVWSGTSRVPGTVGNFINGWTRDSQMYCSDCHKSSTAGDPEGPHGSATPGMLGGYLDPGSARYVTGDNDGAKYGSQAARDADFTFCFGCHDSSFTGTGFTDGGDNLHTKGDHLRACTNCHVAVPHGWNRKHMLYFSIPATVGGTVDPAPYNDHAGDTSYGLPSDMNIDQTPGNWQKEDCNGSGDVCHGG
jgi:predicted CXXCH cytochrome family protein